MGFIMVKSPNMICGIVSKNYEENEQISFDNFGADQFIVMSLKIPLNSIPITASKPPVSEPVHKTLLN